MGDTETLALVEILTKTLRNLEQDRARHDPAIDRLRHSILLIIAELEILKADRAA